MPFFLGTDRAFLATIPPSAKKYDWSRDKFLLTRGQRGFSTLTRGGGEGSRLPQSWRWKTWVSHAGHRYQVWVVAVRNADTIRGRHHIKYYEWCHAIGRGHPMRDVLTAAMCDLDHFSGGCQPSVDAVREVFLAHIKAAIDGGKEGYRDFLCKGRLP